MHSCEKEEKLESTVVKGNESSYKCTVVKGNKQIHKRKHVQLGFCDMADGSL